MSRTFFFTSSPNLERDTINPANHFAARIREAAKDCHRGLFITSDPENAAFTDGYAADMKVCFEKAGVRFERYEALDNRNAERAAELVASSDFLILAGGHVPTQNAFLQRIHLRELMQDYQGVLMSVSAGTMNSADTVYAMPELEGEAKSPEFKRLISGLNLTKTMIIPHFQYLKTQSVDGLNMINDLALPDSAGRTFIALCDGSYVLSEDGRETIYGEAYQIQDGRIRQLTGEGEALGLQKI